MRKVNRQPHNQPEDHDPPRSEHPSDEPGTTNSKSSVRRVNWKGGRGGGVEGEGSMEVMETTR